MNRNILLEYYDMKQEIKDLRNRIEKGCNELEKLNKMVVKDSVACGKKGKKPIRTVKIEGRPTSAINTIQKICEQRIDRQLQLEKELLEMTCQVEEYIASIQKSELRIMFRFYYIDDLSWVQVAHKMNELFPKRKYTEDSCRMKDKRFFEKV